MAGEHQQVVELDRAVGGAPPGAVEHPAAEDRPDQPHTMVAGALQDRARLVARRLLAGAQVGEGGVAAVCLPVRLVAGAAGRAQMRDRIGDAEDAEGVAQLGELGGGHAQFGHHLGLLVVGRCFDLGGGGDEPEQALGRRGERERRRRVDPGLATRSQFWWKPSATRRNDLRSPNPSNSSSWMSSARRRWRHQVGGDRRAGARAGRPSARRRRGCSRARRARRSRAAGRRPRGTR